MIVGVLALATLPLLFGAPRADAPYTPHAPITITGDASFTPENGVTGGSGTTSDPYVIEGWSINSTGSPNAILVENTQAAFVVRNVSVVGDNVSGHYGITLQNATHARVENATVTGTTAAIRAGDSPGVLILNNTLDANVDGIRVASPGSVVQGNAIKGVGGTGAENVVGIDSDGSPGSLIRWNAINDTDFGVVTTRSPGLTIAGNDIHGGTTSGVMIQQDVGITVEGNNLSGCDECIMSVFSDRVQVLGNSIVNDQGVGQDIGIDLYGSTNATLRNNTLARGGVLLWGSRLDEFRSHDIDLSNVVSGRPIRYYRDCDSVTVDGAVTGQLLVANCTGFTAANLDISGVTVGLGMYFVERANISGNRLAGNTLGLRLTRAGNSTVAGNNMSGNVGAGTLIDYSWNDVIVGNNGSSNGDSGVILLKCGGMGIVGNRLDGNGQAGIDTWFSPGTLIVRNTASANRWGIFADGAGTLVYHNNLLNNTQQADDSNNPPGTITWNETYPWGGNYWSNYTGVDLMSGPNQDLPGPDGIGDTPLAVPWHSVDRYPLMRPYNLTNDAPSASFTVSPLAAGTGALITMDPFASRDLQDPTPALLTRWDFEDDGTWDTPLSPLHAILHSYPIAGLYRVRLQVQDTSGATNETTRLVTILPRPPGPPGGLVVSRPNADDIRLDWRAVPEATWYRVYESPDRFGAPPYVWSLLGTTSVTSFTATGQASDRQTHFYLVRAVNQTAEGPNSTMAVKLDLSFMYGPARTNVVWFSLPYVSPYARASDIANDLGSANVDVVGKWDASAQRSSVYYYERGAWRGTDFPIAPGDGLYLGIRQSFGWAVFGTDANATLTFATNPAPTGNVNWVGLPSTGDYARASSIVAELGPTKIREVGLWDPTTQTVLRWSWTGSAWAGTDFVVQPGRGVYLVIMSGFTWTPALATPVQS